MEIVREKTALGLLRRQEKEDRVRLPKRKPILFRDRRALVRVHRRDVRGLLLAPEQVDELELVLEFKIVREPQHLERARARRKRMDLEAHRGGSIYW